MTPEADWQAKHLPHREDSGCRARWGRYSACRDLSLSSQLVQRNRQVADPLAGHVKDGVTDGCSRSCNSNLADASRTCKIQLVIRYVERLDVDLWDVRVDRDVIVREIRVGHTPVAPLAVYTAATMPGYAPQWQIFPLMRSRISSLSRLLNAMEGPSTSTCSFAVMTYSVIAGLVILGFRPRLRFQRRRLVLA